MVLPRHTSGRGYPRFPCASQMKGWIVPGVFVLAAGLGTPRAEGRGEGIWARGDAGSRVPGRDSAVSTGAAAAGWQMSLIPLPSQCWEILREPPLKGSGAEGRAGRSPGCLQAGHSSVPGSAVGRAGVTMWSLRARLSGRQRLAPGTGCLARAAGNRGVTARHGSWEAVAGGLRAANWGLR